MSRRANVCRLACFAGALAFASPAFAYELSETPDGAPLSWATPAVGYDVRFALGDPSGEALAAAGRRAFDTWAYASRGGLSADYRGPTDGARAGDGTSTIGIDPEWDPAFGDPARAVAFAWVQYDPSTGRIREGDVHLNGAAFTFADGARGTFDTESVVLHELGHVLGLAHTCGLPGRTYPSCFSVPDEPEGQRLRVLEAVMAPTLAPGARRRAPNADDIAGLRVGFDGGVEARPRIRSSTVACPGGAWIVELERAWPAALELEVRQANGVRGRREVTVEGVRLVVAGAPPPPGRFDLVVRDAQTGVYDAWVDAPRPAPCVAAADEPEVAPPEIAAGGCTCGQDPPTGSRRHTPGLVILMLSPMLLLRSRRRLTALLAALFALTPAAALAFECSRTQTSVGPSLIWSEREVPWFAGTKLFGVVGDEDVGRADVLASFAAWEQPACSDLVFPFEGVAQVEAGFREDGENHNVVVVVDRLWPYQTGAIAVTTTAYDTRNGVVVDADIEFNDASFEFVHVDEDTQCEARDNLMDLRNTLTHEIGHVVGLEHPPNTARYAETTMFASAPACETKKRTLAQDDIDGLCFIYPAGAPTQQCYPPDGPSFVVVEEDDGFGGCRSTSGGDGVTLAALAVGLLGLARRRSR